MAQNSDQVDVSIKLGADISGGVQSEKQLERIRAKAKETGKDAAKASGEAARGMDGFKKSIGLVRQALTGFGVAGLFTALIAGIQKVTESFGSAEKKALDLQKAADAKALAKSVSDLADQYANLSAKMANAAKEQNDALELIDMEVKARRELAAAKLDAAEQGELAGVDENAVDAEEQKKVIQAKYAHLRDTAAASDKVEDLVLQRQKYTTAAEQKDAEANVSDAEAEAIAKKAQQIRAKAAGEEIAATEATDKDKTGILGYVGGQIRDIFSGNWGNLGRWQTAEGDAEREKRRANAEKLREEADELDKKAEAARESAKAARQDAETNRRRGEALNGSVEAAQLNQSTTQLRNERAEASAAKELTDKNTRLADAQNAERLLSAEKERVKQQIADGQAKKDAANLAVFNAQGDYDLTVANGGKRSAQSSALQNLQAAQTAAQNVNHEADSAINALTETLKNVEARLKAAQSAIQNASKQQNYAWSESPSGT